MTRFQAQTNAVVDQELEDLRERLGLAPSQKSDLLREVTAIASWVIHQAARGRSIEARAGSQVEPLVHPALERLAAQSSDITLPRLSLTSDEVERLSAALERPFEPTPALSLILADLADKERPAPKLRWKQTTG
jgi:hypothetical protein